MISHIRCTVNKAWFITYLSSLTMRFFFLTGFESLFHINARMNGNYSIITIVKYFTLYISPLMVAITGCFLWLIHMIPKYKVNYRQNFIRKIKFSRCKIMTQMKATSRFARVLCLHLAITFIKLVTLLTVIPYVLRYNLTIRLKLSRVKWTQNGPPWYST